MKCNGIIAFIGGALAGAVAAILLAPDSGENTRRKIKERAQQEYDNLKKRLQMRNVSAEPQVASVNDSARLGLTYKILLYYGCK